MYLVAWYVQNTLAARNNPLCSLTFTPPLRPSKPLILGGIMTKLAKNVSLQVLGGHILPSWGHAWEHSTDVRVRSHLALK